MYRITVFTPTRNRDYIIDTLYKSLCAQTFKDFEWLIMDNGTDETEDKVRQYKQDGKIENIKYFHNPERVGINRAMNDAVKVAEGDLFFKVDDDDYLTNDALECIDRWEQTLPKDSKYGYAGVSGLRAYHDGRVIGGNWQHPGDYVDATGLERRKQKLLGDKAEAYYTYVLKKYGPLPEVEGETITFEGMLYDKIAASGLKIRWFNKTIYFTEYLEDGATRNNNRRLEENLNTYGLLLASCLKYNSQPFVYLLKNLCRYSEMCRRHGLRYREAFAKFHDKRFLTLVCWFASHFTKYISPSKEKKYGAE